MDLRYLTRTELYDLFLQKIYKKANSSKTTEHYRINDIDFTVNNIYHLWCIVHKEKHLHKSISYIFVDKNSLCDLFDEYISSNDSLDAEYVNTEYVLDDYIIEKVIEKFKENSLFCSRKKN